MHTRCARWKDIRWFSFCQCVEVKRMLRVFTEDLPINRLCCLIMCVWYRYALSRVKPSKLGRSFCCCYRSNSYSTIVHHDQIIVQFAWFAIVRARWWRDFTHRISYFLSAILFYYSLVWNNTTSFLPTVFKSCHQTAKSFNSVTSGRYIPPRGYK